MPLMRYSTPLVEGVTPAMRGSSARAMRMARPKALNTVSAWWWVLSPDPEGNGTQDIYAALGFMGQHIILVPEHDLIVVVTAGAHGDEEDAILKFFYDEILPSVNRDAK